MKNVLRRKKWCYKERESPVMYHYKPNTYERERERERLSGFDRETDRAVSDALRYFNLSSGWLTCCCAFVCVRVVQTR